MCKLYKNVLVSHLGHIHEPVLVPSVDLLARRSQDAKLKLELPFTVITWRRWPCRYLLETWEVSVAYARQRKCIIKDLLGVFVDTGAQNASR